MLSRLAAPGIADPLMPAGIQNRIDYWSRISPSKLTLIRRPATTSVTLAGNVSLPLIVPSAIPLATACSISRCELMPTIFRNLRMLRLKSLDPLLLLPFRDSRIMPSPATKHRSTACVTTP